MGELLALARGGERDDCLPAVSERKKRERRRSEMQSFLEVTFCFTSTVHPSLALDTAEETRTSLKMPPKPR